MMTPKFEAAFIQCLKDGVYPGPSNINERFRKDKTRLNKLNGQYTKMRLALMYEFGIPYQRGPISYEYTIFNDYRAHSGAGTIPEWPYLHDESFFNTPDYPLKPVQGGRKHEIQDPDKPWELKRK